MSTKAVSLVSVIVPVYNAEKSVERCIQSVIQQTYRNFELIMVDDGSKDCSGVICDNYALKDNRINVIHTTNQGVSHARNTGIDHSNGKYIMFIDSDDWVSPEYIVSLIPADNEDLVAGGYVCITGNKVSSMVYPQPHTTDRKQWQDNFDYWWSLGALMHPWGHCYRRSVIETHHIRFDPSFSIAEDELFNLNYLFHCDLVRYTDACNYNYFCEVETSLMHRHHPNRTESGVAVVQAMERISGKDEYILRWREWQGVIAHHRKYKEALPRAKECLISCYRVKYFRRSLPYIRKQGSLDEKVETFFMFYRLHILFPVIYGLIEKISQFRKK